MPQEPESVSLPEPPSPRPAARDAAIGAALRRFDGAGEPVAAARQRIPWTRRPQFQLAMAASLVLVVGLPAALIALREQGSAPAKVSAPAAPAPRQAGTNPNDTAADAAKPVAGTSEQGQRPPLVASPRQVPAAPPPAVALNEAPAPAAERDEDYAAPPPPPPPPAPAPEMAQKSAEASAGELVVTGTRIPRPSLTSPSPVTVVSSERDQISSVAKRDRSYAAFLERLQAAVGDKDRGAVIRLIRFPLRVNSGGRSQIYPDARSVRRDFDTIFTPRVRQAILAQRADRLFIRDVGAMIGDGEVWFDHVCSDSSCSRPGPVRITAINR
jgi:hypothetical protein